MVGRWKHAGLSRRPLESRKSGPYLVDTPAQRRIAVAPQCHEAPVVLGRLLTVAEAIVDLRALEMHWCRVRELTRCPLKGRVDPSERFDRLLLRRQHEDA